MANEQGSTNRTGAAEVGTGGASHNVGMLLMLLGVSIVIVFAVVRIAAILGLIHTEGVNLANIVLVASAVVILVLGGALRFMERAQ